MSEHEGLPIPGYRPQSQTAVKVVTAMKQLEERILRCLDEFGTQTEIEIDKRWLAIGRTLIEQGFMAINRSIFRPERVALPDDAEATSPEKATESGWLIEVASSPASAPDYIAAGEDGPVYTVNHHAALRFARKLDAERFAAMTLADGVRIAFHEWG
jgi:hypothetical protein